MQDSRLGSAGKVSLAVEQRCSGGKDMPLEAAAVVTVILSTVDSAVHALIYPMTTVYHGLDPR